MKKLFSLFAVYLLLVSCSFENNKINNDFYVQLKEELNTMNNADYKVLYDIYNSRFVLYDIPNMQIKHKPTLFNYFQYSFNNKSEYYTTGYSTEENDFKIIQLLDNKINTIFESNTPANFGIFPLATDGKNNFFIRYTYIHDAAEVPNTRKIVLLNDKNELVEFENTSGNIKGGAIINNYLYYTIYIKETDSFSLYKIDISDSLNKPIHLEDNLCSEELFNYKGKLYKSNGEEIYCDEEPDNRFKFCSYNYFDNENDVLIQISVNENADLVLSVTDIETKEILGEFISPINFDISENELTVYCVGNIYHLDL